MFRHISSVNIHIGKINNNGAIKLVGKEQQLTAHEVLSKFRIHSSKVGKRRDAINKNLQQTIIRPWCISLRVSQFREAPI